ncbi:MAG: hypothetical protein ACR2QX_03075 [Woeseiaceae bacterium]
MKRLIQILSLAVALSISLPAAAKERNLDRWFDQELVPFVTTQLVEHPRFKNETVMFVVLENNAPAAVSNALALSLRDRLLDAALNTAGVSIGWRQGGTPTTGSTQAIDCTRDDVHYYIGLELSKHLDGTYGITVRALDLEDRNWVSGFSESWKGQLSTIQRQAVRESSADKTFRGARDVPFVAQETDLLAAHLAHKLSCALHRETSGSYVVAADRDSDTSDNITATAELVGNNLAGQDALELTNDDARINASLSGKAHRIDGALFQYWLTVTPKNPDDELSTLSASAYILMPGIRLADQGDSATQSPPAAANDPKPLPPERHANATISVPNAVDNPFFGPLRIFESNNATSCGAAADSTVQRTTYNGSQQACSLLAASTRRDAIVFVLEHQANYGLVRLGGPTCRERTSPHVVTRGQLMRYPIPYTSIGSSQARETPDWLVSPDIDTYYAFAVTDARAARQFANHFDQLPMRCSSGLRPGLTNNALHRWLDEFAVLAARHAGHVDWRAIEVKDVL